MNNSNIELFGLHLMFDGYNCDPGKLDDREYVFNVIDGLREHIGMTELTKPVVVKALGNDHHDPGGLSGFVIIKESHISVHTFVKRKFVTADVYSCKQFDTNSVTNYLKKAFATEDADIFIQKRGLRYPKENLI
ncbi:hypothetical protein A2690_01005 [Candidatus Roizmanbacteria bacterium RIFCSPHIGHO2_01_FULL_39_12b]|uniref:S-adenosylmethionine decarboxylase proenzyme n=1 Tax=Candidatus Roizmanbacteria bacterium RIFCSPHIGHO2_01_FULL_39_12b TaxID=1802030 RepID=A0A1F7GAW9_9BACT|nr:MAG: hypothetical protein A2690_01005 [Candidatus Roizmanbacteria bacterium RIFCSPHIGHO2_01_FULL_39_12b]